MGVETLVALSNYFGSDPDWVLAGGGNTSFKDDDYLYIKASGTQLATITADGFAKMDRRKLSAIWDKTYPTETAAREKQSLADLMAARMPGEEQKRPSVETLMHDLFPYAYVLHTHPARINGLTCGADGAALCMQIFPDALWIPMVNPGYVLATVIRDAAKTYEHARGTFPRVVFLENHGLVVAGDDPDETKARKEAVMATVTDHIQREPDLTEAEGSAASAASSPSGQKAGRGGVSDAKGVAAQDSSALGETLAGALSALSGERWYTRHTAAEEILRLAADKESFSAVSRPFSPDHVVYSGHRPLLLQAQEISNDCVAALERYRDEEGTLPKTVAVSGVGAFGCATTEKAAESARMLFLDAAKIAVYSESFGGPKFMPPDQVDFIRGWEVEKYRERVNRG